MFDLRSLGWVVVSVLMVSCSAPGPTTDGGAARCAANERVSANACVPCAAGTSNAAGDDPSGTDTTCEATRCAANERVSANACVPCPTGATNAAGNDASGPDTTCDATRCAADHRVSAHACLPCPAGATNAAGDDASGPDTTCDAARCPADQRVSAHACVACAPGTTNAAGDDASGPDTTCDGTRCASNQRVNANACVPCAAGTTNAAGDDASGPDTTCDATRCAADQRVSAHACVACAPGTTNAAADDASGPDTSCDTVLCAANERVVSHACVACAPGTTNAAADDASGADTTCDAVQCAVNQHVVNHACVPCAAGSLNPAGDDAAGANTSCLAQRCGANQRVSAHACVACAPGTTNVAGDDATAADTQCDGVLCASNQHVVANACEACLPGSTRPAGDDASGADTACQVTLCGLDEFVSGHACSPCRPGSVRPAGDPATGADTTCAPVLCPADSRVQNHACVACTSPGTTRPAGDDASGADTVCTPVLCPANHYVVSHACVACASGSTRAAGDDASGADTDCTAPTFTWTPARTSTLLRENDELRVVFSENVVASSLTPLTGSLATVALTRWDDARTLVVLPSSAWPVGAASLAFSVADAFGNRAQVSLSGTVVQSVWADVLVGNDANPGAETLPVKRVALALARARELGPEFPVFARLAASAAPADIDVSAVNFEDVNLTCLRTRFDPQTIAYSNTVWPDPGSLLLGGVKAQLRSTPGHSTRLTGCVFKGLVQTYSTSWSLPDGTPQGLQGWSGPGDGPLSYPAQSEVEVVGGTVTMVDTVANRVITSGGTLDLSTTLTTSTQPTYGWSAQRHIQTVARELIVTGGTLRVSHALVDWLRVSGGVVETDNVSAWREINVSGGALTYRGGRVGNGYMSGTDRLPPVQPIVGVVLSGAAPGARHEFSGVYFFGNPNLIRATQPGATYEIFVHDSFLTGSWNGDPQIVVEGPTLRLERNDFMLVDGEAVAANGSRLEVLNNIFGHGYWGSRLTCISGDYHGLISGNVFDDIVTPIAHFSQDPTIPVLRVVGNTFINAWYPLQLTGRERIEHNLVISPSGGPPTNIALWLELPVPEPDLSPVVRWNHFAGYVTLFADMLGRGSEPVLFGNTSGEVLPLGPLGRPTPSTACAAMKTTATLADQPLLATLPLDRTGAPRTLPYSAGAYESDVACGCARNEHVSNGVCVACPSGDWRWPGDVTPGPNTACSVTFCDVNQYVVSNQCAPCAPGSVNAAGDDARGADTSCDKARCAEGQRVQNAACVACPAGEQRPASDDPTAGNTPCFAVQTTWPLLVQDAGPGALWHLDETTNPIVDAKGGPNGTAANVIAGVPGLVKPTTALRFNGSSSYVEVPYSAARNPAGAFTIEAWVQPTAQSTSFSSIVTSRGANFTGYALYLSPSRGTERQLLFWVGDGSSWQVAEGPWVEPGLRYHVVGTYSPTTGIAVWVNGISTGGVSNVTAARNVTRPLRIGAGATEAAPSFYFAGDIDEVAIYPRALLAPEILEHYVTGGLQQ